MSIVTALEAPLSISNAIKKASRATGVDFSYLLNTAARESSFNKSAKAKTSSAAGLFQFIESTWLKTVKDAGDEFGLGKYTPHIFKTRSGRYYVPNQKLRQEILQLRHNPEISAMMAGAFTQQNSEIVEAQVGRKPTDGELYIAHFLGADGAAELISLAENRPNARADRHFPAAARANRPIFYSRGRPRTVAQVYKNLVRHHQKLDAKGAAQTAARAESSPAAASRKAAKSQSIAVAQQVAETPAAQSSVSAAKTASPEAIPAGPARQVVPSEQDLKFLTHSASFPSAQKAQAVSAVSIGQGVETEIIEPAYQKQAIGLAGQTGAPVAKPERVASLVQGRTNLGSIGSVGAAKAPAGSIGAWTTIVHPPQVESPPPPAPSGREGQTTQAGDQAQEEYRGRSRRKARGARVLEQSAQRESMSQRSVRRAAERFGGSNFWSQMALNGG